MKHIIKSGWAKSLKNLRGIIGVTQEDLAELVGVATITIKVAEGRGGKVTRKLGAQIQMATGAIIGESKLTAHGLGPYEPLKGNTVIAAWTRKGAVAFTLGSFEAHLKLKRESGSSEWTEDMVRTLTTLFKTAARENANVHALRWSFMVWAQEAIERFKLPVTSPLASALPVKPLRDASKSSRRG
jgi:DNA-binding XRE family transcriptional regulator